MLDGAPEGSPQCPGGRERSPPHRRTRAGQLPRGRRRVWTLSTATFFDPMLRLTYILHKHGCAMASIGDGEATIEMDVSFLGDGLGELARAARGILRGLPETRIRFQQEPGEYRFAVSRQDDRVRVTVQRFAETYS